MPHSPPVCVTGASGFIAAHIIRELLAQGYTVKGTVRDLKNPQKYAFLTELPQAKQQLQLIAADLLTEHAYDAAVADCECVIHTASPYAVNVKNPQQELINPAVDGTKNVLNACSKAGSVKRIVLTSSIAAITDEPIPNKIFTETDWNTQSSLTRNPYYYSKALAEQTAWQYVQQTSPQLDLITINPYMVIGPSLSPHLNTSNQIFRDLMTGDYPGILSLTWGFVDVRDVALAHILAMNTPQANGRYLCANDTRSMRQIITLLKTNGYAQYPFPSLNLAHKLGDLLLKIASYTQKPGTGSYLRTHIGKAMLFNNQKIRQQLGLDFRPVDRSILETVTDLLKWGHISADAAVQNPK